MTIDGRESFQKCILYSFIEILFIIRKFSSAFIRKNKNHLKKNYISCNYVVGAVGLSAL